ncbi:single-pass membrane and coiled-coil domain-containing protein 1 isoform X2 [Microcaecilia unicolor]|uniref:Single-pass membrane and coiled-coil domain-containing protein 1 isoform X2 n=2 Tax=Microcaecilia unicolor TaxID=1415580 RepID=A0A6P7Z0R2_9AMPH|nr:single-pass membrane and coiled-coil domain-containing protein 1 isoform X2 [Microcaecilia unicolor]
MNERSMGDMEKSTEHISAVIKESKEKLTDSQRRLEHRVHMLEAQFNDLQCTAEELTQRLEIQGETLVRQANHDEMWTSLLEDRFSTMELNIFYSYVIEMLSFLHSRVVQNLPDMEGHLPTLASILRNRSNSQEISEVWDAVLEKLELQEDEVKTLCTFFITHCYEAKYYTSSERQQYVDDISAMILRVVKNQTLKRSLLCAVQVLEKKKTEKSMDNLKEKS